MCLALLSGDIKMAFLANPVLLVSLPGLVAVLTDATVRYVRKGYWRTKGWSTVLVWILTIALIVFGVLRNL